MTNKEIQMVILLNLISNDPDNPGIPILPEVEQKNIYDRWKEDNRDHNWEYIFEPINDKITKQKLIDLFKELDNPEE